MVLYFDKYLFKIAYEYAKLYILRLMIGGFFCKITNKVFSDRMIAGKH